jgi:hypothetical protein
MPSEIEAQFHEAMLTIYKRAKAEAHYPANRFLGMVVETGGLATARYLLHAEKVSDGYTALWERGRLDLTVEAMVLDAKWRPLFTDEERGIAVARLRLYGYAGPLQAN